MSKYYGGMSHGRRALAKVGRVRMVAKWILTMPWNLIEKHSKSYNLDSRLVGAIICTESAGNECTTRYESGWKYFYQQDEYAKTLGITVNTEMVHQATSWGLMQIMGSVAREQGFADHLNKLTNPNTNLIYGCSFLVKLYKKYGLLPDVIASYNAGSPRKDESGNYVNHQYVDKVTKFMNDLV